MAAAMFALLNGAAIAQVAQGNPVPKDQAPDDHVTVSSSDTSRKLARHESGNPAAPNTIYYRITLCKGAGPKENTFRPPKSDLIQAGLKGGPDQVGQGATSDNKEKGGAAGLFNGTDGTLSITGSNDGILTWQLKDGNGNTATFKLRVHFVDCSEDHGAHSGSKNPHEKEISMSVVTGTDDQQYATTTGQGTATGGGNDVNFQATFENAGFNGPFYTAAFNHGSQPFGGVDGTKPDCTFDMEPPTLQLEDAHEVQSVSGDIAKPAEHEVQSVSGDLGGAGAGLLFGGHAKDDSGGSAKLPPSVEEGLKLDEAYGKMMLSVIDGDRDEFEKAYDALPPGLKTFIDYDETMKEFDRREARAQAKIRDAHSMLEKSAAADNKPANTDTPNAPSGNTPPPTNEHATTPDTQSTPSDGKPTSDNTTPPASSTPASSGGAPTNTTTTTSTNPDQGMANQSQTTSNQDYQPIGFKYIASVKPGDTPREEPGKQISWFAKKEEPDLSKKPQQGYNKDPVTCITGANGSCETKIATDERQTYQITKPGKVQYTFTSMLTRGGYNEVTGGKLDPTQTFGHTLRIVQIGQRQFAAYTWSSFYGTGDGYPRGNLIYIVDNCEFMLPAPWGADFNTPPAHSDLPAGVLQLGPAAGIAQ